MQHFSTSKQQQSSMAFRGVISVGRQANTSPFSFPPNLRTTQKVHASNSCLKSTPIPHYRSGVRFSIRAVNRTAVDNLAPKKESQEASLENWKVKMLYDGECHYCVREVNKLRGRNEGYKSIKFVDISLDDYSPEDNQGLDYETAMGRIHVILSDGTVVKDVEAFRKLYEAAGLGWVYAITKNKPIESIANAFYGVWAKYRLQVTGRPPLEEVLEARKKKKEMCGDSKICKM